MIQLNHVIARKIAGSISWPVSPEIRSRVGILEGWISAATNFLLFIIKGALGFASGSVSLMADAFHTLTDVLSSIVVIIGFHISRKPADQAHPYGHGRAEMIATLTLALMIGFIGLEFLKGGFERLIHPRDIQVSAAVILAVLATVAVKEWLARLSYHLGDLIDSDTLRGDAAHHRSDVYSSLLVVAALVGQYIGWRFLDGMMALGVSGFLLVTAYQIARGAIDDILGKPIPKKLIDQISNTAESVQGVYKIHDVVVHNYGGNLFISLHVEVSENQPPDQMHGIADQVERKISSELSAQVITHIDPVSIEGPQISRIQELIRDTLSDLRIDAEIQDLRVVGNKTVNAIIFEVPVGLEFNKHRETQSRLENDLRGHYPQAKIQIEFRQQITSV